MCERRRIKMLRKIAVIILGLLSVFIASCTISVNQTTLDFGSTEITKTFTLVVNGPVEWSIYCEDDWVTVDHEEGSTTRIIEVNVDRTGLASGSYDTTLEIFTNSNIETPSITVHMTVLGPPCDSNEECITQYGEDYCCCCYGGQCGNERGCELRSICYEKDDSGCYIAPPGPPVIGTTTTTTTSVPIEGECHSAEDCGPASDGCCVMEVWGVCNSVWGGIPHRCRDYCGFIFPMVTGCCDCL
jgi:hypothetical protein